MQLIHQPTAPWLFEKNPDRFVIRLWSAPGVFRRAEILYSDPYDYLPSTEKQNRLTALPMTLLWENREQIVWTAEAASTTQKLLSLFRCERVDGSLCWFGENGVQISASQTDAFRTGRQFGGERRPIWTGRSVWYQVFPDRFAGGKTPPEAFIPSTSNRWGGTLDGIRENIPYLKSLGVTGVYLNPVFSSPSNHRYDTLDYTHVDEKLGNNESLIRLADALHENGLRLMLDGVFNHASRQCPQFQDVLCNGDRSRYRDWFCIHSLNQTCSTSEKELTSERMKAAPPYESFAFASNMVKWNTDNPQVQDYLIGCAEQWTRRLRLDAWRLDVPDEISPAFLRTFRRRMKRMNPEVLLIGEIWTQPSPWVQGGLFDGTMNYPLYRALLHFLLRGDINAETFCLRMEEITHTLPLEIARNQMNFIGNHDLARPLTEASDSLSAVQAAWLLLCLLDGEANLYYGDERAMYGGNDPENRGVMRWQESQNATQMVAFVKRTALLRQKLLSQPLYDFHFHCTSEHCAVMLMRREKTMIRLALYNARNEHDGCIDLGQKPYWFGERFQLFLEETC